MALKMPYEIVDEDNEGNWKYFAYIFVLETSITLAESNLIDRPLLRPFLRSYLHSPI